jgi:hypothetical protein|tara:strand:+ start:1861 stop:2055 length:195 start_codon:yes stop_codon:yes gene_type:complete
MQGNETILVLSMMMLNRVDDDKLYYELKEIRQYISSNVDFEVDEKSSQREQLEYYIELIKDITK